MRNNVSVWYYNANQEKKVFKLAATSLQEVRERIYWTICERLGITAKADQSHSQALKEHGINRFGVNLA